MATFWHAFCAKPNRDANLQRFSLKTSDVSYLTPKLCLGFARSVSWIAHRPSEERASIMRALDGLLTDGPFAIPMTANVNWTVRT